MNFFITESNAQHAGCRFPGAPAHSSVSFTDNSLGPGTVATYICERGFELLGPSRRVCENGQWLPEGIPFCGMYKIYCICKMSTYDHFLGHCRSCNFTVSNY